MGGVLSESTGSYRLFHLFDFQRDRPRPITVSKGRTLRRLDLTPSAPENIRVRNWNSETRQMLVDSRFVRENEVFISTVRDCHDIYVAELRAALAPVSMRENMVTPHFAARFDFTSCRNGPMEKRVEAS